MKFLFQVIAIGFCISLIEAKSTTETAVNSTEEPDESTEEPSIPSPSTGSWNISDGSNVCIRAKMRIRFKVLQENETLYFVLPANASTDGSDCQVSPKAQLLWLNSELLSLSFKFIKDGFRVSLQRIDVTASLPDYKVKYSNDSTSIYFGLGHSYACKSLTKIEMKDATLEILSMQIQAFAGKEDFFGIPEVCTNDDKLNDVVPIAVACALAVLIVVVLIAYLYGRRRSRQKGYNSV